MTTLQRLLSALCLGLLIGCAGGSASDDDDDGGWGSGEEGGGSGSGSGGEENLPVDWEPSVRDFESGAAVSGAAVEATLDDAPGGSPADEGTSDSSGELSLGLQSCLPFTWSVSAEGFVPTHRQHVVLDESGVGDGTDEVTLISENTANLIPALLGVSWDDSAALVTGRVRDESGDPIAGATVSVPGGEVFYFVDSFPMRDATETGEDGYFFAVNVDAKAVTVVAKGEASGEAPARAIAGEVLFVDVIDGRQDGLLLPTDCD